MLTVRGHAVRSPQYECDHGYVGEAGVCVDWVPRADREPVPEADRTPCGKLGEPVCADDMMNGARPTLSIPSPSLCLAFEKYVSVHSVSPAPCMLYEHALLDAACESSTSEACLGRNLPLQLFSLSLLPHHLWGSSGGSRGLFLAISFYQTLLQLGIILCLTETHPCDVCVVSWFKLMGPIDIVLSARHKQCGVLVLN